ncbi:MAG: cytochrome c3 family protein, partial [Planctomycetota bacterium]|nr:cytochrome c3 family protein [Planctomycetota bacterium]
CHGNAEIWDGETRHLYVPLEDFATDIHAQKGLQCHDCHGGNPDTLNLREAHAIEDGFRDIKTPADVPEFCGRCHSNADYMQRFRPDARTNLVARFLASAHGRHLQNVGGPAAATCTSCHATHTMRAVDDPAAAVHATQLSQTCGSCHKDQQIALRKSVHHAVGPRNQRGSGTPLECSKCHVGDVHAILPVSETNSPVHLEHQVQTCGECHPAHLATYEVSPHGTGLYDAGLMVTAVCADCHGAHDIYYAADRRSSLHSSTVAATCGKCHKFIEDRLANSVHAQNGGNSPRTERTAGGGKIMRAPSCVDCHQGHDQAQRDALGRQVVPLGRCGNCHAEMLMGYGISMHGELTQRGYVEAAQCADCHGAHDILAIHQPASRLSPANRAETCRQCHSQAGHNFAEFDPHANPKDEARYPLLHAVYAQTENAIYLLFGLFFLHALFWFARSLIQTLRFGRHERLATETNAFIRFTAGQRLSYLVMIVSFLGLALSGMSLKYHEHAWAQLLASGVGGFETTSILHRFFAITVLVGGALHLARATQRIRAARRKNDSWKKILLGPDSPLPNRRDAKDMWGMTRWFFGLAPKPVFERWAYWEKLDYWAVWLAVVLIGTSGLMLWFPNLFCLVLPGWTLNLSKVVHASAALLASGMIFAIHFFNTHFRPEKFPMDQSLLTGMVREDHIRMARPEFLERLEREGKLEQRLTRIPSHQRLWPMFVGGLFILVAGVVLLAWLVIASVGR